MNKLLISVAASALLLPLAAHAGEKNAQADKQEQKIEKTTQTKTMTYEAQQDVTMDHSMDQTVYLGPTTISGKDLLGEGIHNPAGERIARIDDIVIGADGKASSVVFLSGGVFGLGGKRGALNYDTVNVGVKGDHEPVVSVSLSEEAIQSAAEYETTAMNDYSLASEIIGAKAELTANGAEAESVVISDILLSQNGSVEYLIVQDSIIGMVGGGEKHAVAYSKLNVEQGDGGLVLNMSKSEVNAAPMFKSMMHSADKAWEDTSDAVEDAADDMEDEIDQ